MSEHDPHRTDTRSDEQRALDDSRVIASELLGAVVSLIPDAAVVADPEGRIVSVNAHLEQLFRYSSGSLTGLSVEILIPERVRRRHQGLRASYMDDPQIRSMGAGLHLTGRRSDGTEFPIDISLAPITNSGNQLVVAAIRDVSQQRQAAAAQAELATIVSSSSDAIFTTSLDGHLTNWNPGAETLFGFNKEEILGLDPYPLDDEMSRYLYEEHPVESSRKGWTSYAMMNGYHRNYDECGQPLPPQRIRSNAYATLIKELTPHGD